MTPATIALPHTRGHRGVIGSMTVSIRPGENTLVVDGWAESSVVELRETLLLAIRSTGLEFPEGHISVCSSLEWPAHPQNLDLPIAVALLAASGQIPRQALQDLYVGHLNVAGHARHSTGVFPMLQEAARQQYRRAAVPVQDAVEARHSAMHEILPVQSLKQLTDHLNGTVPIQPAAALPQFETKAEQPPPYVDLAWQSTGSEVRRVLEVAAAGRHHVFLSGSPGSGRTLMGRLLPWLMPALDPAEQEEKLALMSVANHMPSDSQTSTARPFRAPHFTVSTAGLIGNGRRVAPGDASLAHRGVLLIDDATQFHRQQMEMLAVAMERRSVSFNRLGAEFTFPADFTLAVSATPCPCGYAEQPDKVCVCNPESVNRHRRSIPGALSDRLHIGINLPLNSSDEPPEPLAEVQSRVANAWTRRQEWKTSDRYMPHDPGAQALLAAATRKQSLPPLRVAAAVVVAATVAHLLELDEITPACMEDALLISAKPWNSDVPAFKDQSTPVPIRNKSSHTASAIPSQQARLNI